MAHETLTGASIPALLAEARELLGPDARVLRVERQGRRFLLVATDDPADESPAEPDFRDVLVRRVPASATPMPVPRPGRPLVLALVGPTGAGKTTTLAKLATSRHAFARRSVGIIGMDTHRVGAVEQLRTLAGLAGIPVETAWTPDDVTAAMRRLAGCDTILLDTPGRGPALGDDLDEIAAMLRAAGPDEVHLALPAGRIWRVSRAALAQHRRLGVTHLLATKIDECPDDWGVFDLSVAERLPMRWMTDGQDVPRDVRPAEDRISAAGARRHSARRAAEVA